MDFLTRLAERAKERQSKRLAFIEEHGRDPKTNLTVRQMELSEVVRPRGGKNSRRRTTLDWKPVSTDAD